MPVGQTAAKAPVAKAMMENFILKVFESVVIATKLLVNVEECGDDCVEEADEDKNN